MEPAGAPIVPVVTVSTSSVAAKKGQATSMNLPPTGASTSMSQLLPIPPSTPKPSNLPISVRHKFVNHSIGSLTAADTRDYFEEDIRADDDEASDSSDCESSLSESDEDVAESSSALWRRGGGPSPKAPTVGDLATVQEAEDDFDKVSEVNTNRLSNSSISECDPAELDEMLDEAKMLEARLPLFNVEEGILPPTSNPRCPPIAWLRAAGFDVPSRKGFDSAPVAPVCGEKPERYLDLFSRQMIARERTSDLTVGALTRHDAALGRVRHAGGVPKVVAKNPADLLCQNGEWLQAFIAKARAVPMHAAVENAMGTDIGFEVANFLDRLSDCSEPVAQIATEDIPDGLHVTGQKMRMRPVHQGRGRAGFIVDCDVVIATPGRSQSPPPRREPPALSLEPPQPPMIAGPLQPFSQRRVWGRSA